MADIVFLLNSIQCAAAAATPSPVWARTCWSSNAASSLAAVSASVQFGNDDRDKKRERHGKQRGMVVGKDGGDDEAEEHHDRVGIDGAHRQASVRISPLSESNSVLARCTYQPVSNQPSTTIADQTGTPR